MNKITVTLAGLSSVALCTATLANVDVGFSLTGSSGTQVDYAIDMSGTLGNANITCNYSTDWDSWTSAGDLLIGVVDPSGNAVEFGGWDLSLGYPSAGEFPSSWDTSSSGTYSHSFDLSGYGLSGSGQWTVQFANGFSDGSADDHWQGTLSLVGMTPGNTGYGGCCIDQTCHIVNEAACLDGDGTYLGDGTTCDGWPCGGSPAGACCLGVDCLDSNANACATLGGSFAGEGSTCAQGPCDPVEGDTCETAIETVEGSYPFDTETATDSDFGYPDETQCEDSDLSWEASPDLWFVWAAPDDGTFAIDTCDSNGSLDTSLVLYEGDSCDTLVQIACNGDSAAPAGCQDYMSTIDDIQVTAGATFYIRVGGWEGDVGTGTLNINFEHDTSVDRPMTFATIGADLVDAATGNWTVDLFVIVGEGGRVDAVAGTNDQTKMLTCSGDFYQNTFGGPTSMEINPAFYGIEPDLEWDSRVTIGAIDATGNPFGDNALQNIGMNWTPFENGDDLVANNGTWFILPTDGQGEAQEMLAADCSTVHAVRIARLTATGMSDMITFEGLIQGQNPDGSLLSASAYIETGYVAMEDCNDNGVNDTCDIANGTSADTNGDGIPDECESTCPGDATGDGLANVNDILAVIGAYKTGPGPADVNNDGVVNVNDLLQVISWFDGC